LRLANARVVLDQQVPAGQQHGQDHLQHRLRQLDGSPDAGAQPVAQLGQLRHRQLGRLSPCGGQAVGGHGQARRARAPMPVVLEDRAHDTLPGKRPRAVSRSMLAVFLVLSDWA
jgi:hypothetical protein